MDKEEILVKRLIEKIDENPSQKNYYNLGTLLVKLQSYSQAEELFKKAISAFKNVNVDLLIYGLGNVYYEYGLYSKAKHEFSKIKSLNLKNQVMLMFAQIEYVKKDYKKALAYALTGEQDIYKLRIIADSFFNLGDFKSAKEYYSKILKNNDKAVHELFFRGLCNFTLGFRQLSTVDFKLVEKIDKKYYKRKTKEFNEVHQFLMNSEEKNGRE